MLSLMQAFEEQERRNKIAIATSGNGGRGDIPATLQQASPEIEPASNIEEDGILDQPAPLTYLTQTKDCGLVYEESIFKNKKELHLALSMLALQECFCYKVHHSDKSRVNVKCVDAACKWGVFARGFVDCGSFKITRYTPIHTCGAEAKARYVEKATSKVIGQHLIPRFANGKTGPRVNEIPKVVLSELKVPITYMKAWYAKQAAVATGRGKQGDHYRVLSEYMELLVKSNPGSLTDLLFTYDNLGNRHFKYLFVAFGAAIHGWRNVRKVVGIDGTRLKGKGKRCLLAASSQDGNLQILPLAFAVVDSENEESWTWFLKNLTQIVDDENDLVLVSDRNPSVCAALKKVFPNSVQVCCIVHLKRDVKKLSKVRGLGGMVKKAACAFTKTDFRYWWKQIQNVSPECAQYLEEVGFERWTRAHCEGDRYNIMSSDICESLNLGVGPAVEFPIIKLVENLRTMFTGWFATRREESTSCWTKCTPVKEKVLVDNMKIAAEMSVLPASRTIFQVNDSRGSKYSVDLVKNNCTCNAFQKLRIPCIHAMAARAVHDVDVYSLVDQFHYRSNWFNIYRSVVMSVPDAEGDETIVVEEESPN